MQDWAGWFFSRTAGAICGFEIAYAFNGRLLAGAVAGAAFAMTLDFTLKHVRETK